MNRKYFTRKAFALSMLGLLLTAESCKKFTDLQPNAAFAETTAFTTPERVALALTGVYSAAQSGPYITDNSNRGYPFGAANTIQGDMRGEDMISVPSFFNITYINDYDATQPNNTSMWTTLYALINRANVVIEGVKGAAASGVITAQVATRAEAECRFLRALAYHELMIHFALPYKATADASHLGVVLRLTAVNSPERVDEEKTKTRNTVKECYAQILTDLDFAEANLAPRTAGTSLSITRATPGAAVALKTRVKLHMGDYEGVIAEGTKLGTAAAGPAFTSPATLGSYALTAAPNGPFASATAGLANSESIFSIEHATTRNAGTNGSISTMYSNAPGRGLIAVSPIIYNAPFWLPADLRRTTLLVASTRTYFTTKYKDPATFTDPNPIIRYAEVLLNTAEAYSRTGNIAQGLALLNAVRNRAVTTAADRFTSFASAFDLTQAILNERRIEFLAEGKRWGDIHRLVLDPNFSTGGIPAKASFANALFNTYVIGTPYPSTPAARSIPAIPYTGAANSYKFIWPIPSVEISANPVLAKQQNPNY
jgi:hypothetical protein